MYEAARTDVLAVRYGVRRDHIDGDAATLRRGSGERRKAGWDTLGAAFEEAVRGG